MISALYSVISGGYSCLRRLFFAPDTVAAELIRYNSLFTSRISQLQMQQQHAHKQLSQVVTELSLCDSLYQRVEAIWAASSRALAGFVQTLQAQDRHLRPYTVVHEISDLTKQTVEDCQRLQIAR